MSRVFLTMAMSLDGFITGPDDDAEHPAGIDGMRLMDWLSPDGDSDQGGDADSEGGARRWRPKDPQSRVVYDEAMATGAVLAGRRTAEFAGYWGGDHHDGVPIFVPTRRSREDSRFERVHFVTDGIASCVELAKAAAGGRDVMMHGAYTAQQALRAGVLDSIELQVRPFLLGRGRRLFDDMPPGPVDLELVRVLQAPQTLHLRYDVRR
jgi:dihydrofolate reductase